MRWALVIAPLAVVSCGLDLDGLGPRALHPGDAGSGSDGSVAPDDAGPGTLLDAATGPCVTSIPAGWSLVILEQARDPCPAALTPHDLVGDPQAMAGACSCTCTITTQPSCTSGTLQGSFGNASGSAACSTKVLALPISGSGCTQLQPGGQAPTSIAIDALPSTGGACTFSAVGNTTLVATTNVRTCDVAGPGSEGVCAGSPPAGFSACIAAAGEMACPSGSPFASRTVLAASETLVCTACTGCTVNGNCSSPLVTYYSDYLCNNPVATFPADGACTQPNWNGNLAGVEYHASVQASCAATGSTATFQAASPQTVCCR
jgi:hypothetical protein